MLKLEKEPLSSPWPVAHDAFQIAKSPAYAELLDCLPSEYQTEILQQCRARHYRRHQQIVRELQPGSKLYFINRGRVRVTLIAGDGKEVSFMELYAGDNFGELSAIDGEPHSVNVIAQESTTIIAMPVQIFHRILHNQPEFCLLLLKRMSCMMRRLRRRIFEYSTLDIQQRIRAELLRLAKENVDLDGVSRVANPPTHAEFARRISCHREAVSRELKKLERQGVFKKDKRRLIFPDYRQLQPPVEAVSQMRLARRVSGDG